MFVRVFVLFVSMVVLGVSFASAQTVTVTVTTTITQGTRDSNVYSSGRGSSVAVNTPTPRPQTVYYYLPSENVSLQKEEPPTRSSGNTVLRALGAIAIIGGSHVGAEALGQRIRNPGLRILGVGSVLYTGHKFSEWIER